MSPDNNLVLLKRQLITLAKSYGVSGVTVSYPDLTEAHERYQSWLNQGYAGSMHFLERHSPLKKTLSSVYPNTARVISLAFPYFNQSIADSWNLLNQPDKGYISCYATGQDYHRVIRKILKKIMRELAEAWAPYGYRLATDSAPLMEVAIADQSGLGWTGKNTLLLRKEGGSLFFLAEILTDLPLPTDSAVANHCGRCTACLSVCPTQAFIKPYLLDARRCISYLTIEHEGVFPMELRPLMGNRIYGCDDCQLICPWNRFATPTIIPDFIATPTLQKPSLISLFLWDEETFKTMTYNTPIYRIGHERWLRNIAIALGNGPKSSEALQALTLRKNHLSATVQEHVNWAINRLSMYNDTHSSENSVYS